MMDFLSATCDGPVPMGRKPHRLLSLLTCMGGSEEGKVEVGARQRRVAAHLPTPMTLCQCGTNDRDGEQVDHHSVGILPQQTCKRTKGKGDGEGGSLVSKLTREGNDSKGP